MRSFFDYLPPPGLAALAVPIGARVRVPLGSREAIGVVIECASESSVSPAALKPVRELIDSVALLDAPLMRLLRWTADYYHHPIGEVIASALPKALREGADAAAQVECRRIAAAGTEALAAGAARRAPRQLELLTLLAATAPGIASSALEAQLGDWRSLARARLTKGGIERFEQSTTPIATASGVEPAPGPPLSAAQREAVAAIDAAAAQYAVFALQGATGSGKTEVYLQCAASTLARGRSVLVLVPEIALTPQLVGRFRERLTCNLAVMHSGLGDAERLSAWRAARAGVARVVLGTRSAVFAPLPDLGLIVVDEEHDSSYKQHESGCRYSARDLAVLRAQQSNAAVVLGSATPAFETLQNLKRGRYQQLTLPRRDDQAEAPRLILVDVRAHGLHQGLSTPVIDALRRHLAAGSQVLVFINRRGYAPTLLCTACGWIAPCHDWRCPA